MGWDDWARAAAGCSARLESQGSCVVMPENDAGAVAGLGRIGTSAERAWMLWERGWRLESYARNIVMRGRKWLPPSVNNLISTSWLLHQSGAKKKPSMNQTGEYLRLEILRAESHEEPLTKKVLGRHRGVTLCDNYITDAAIIAIIGTEI